MTWAAVAFLYSPWVGTAWALTVFLPQVFRGHLGVFLPCPGVHFVPSLGCLAEPTELGAHRTGVQSPQLWAGLLAPVDVFVLRHDESCVYLHHATCLRGFS